MCLLVAKGKTHILAVSFLEKKLQWVKQWERWGAESQGDLNISGYSQQQPDKY